ncbi:pentapeptide repeat-containing protein [Actinophytocola xanthii]|uniref:pentapeptide repeat-containing protein n=1 Tax=Actinophytocola xanthii TaxID=1912961 RepID=UPI0011783BC7|nr:pentapeptide repeat-containing protein [Actinophytocola xanthii]
MSIGVGGGGVFALYLAWRRQQSTEADLDNRERMLAQQERVAHDNRADATERRITELYTKGVEQLGSDKAPVRLGGLYALERLAQDNRAQRQTIVNVLCAYLRMPYVEPGQNQEREVRLAAQRVLRDHLRRGQDDKFWPGMEIDLTGAELLDFDLTGCRVHLGKFQSARFVGTALFDSTTFVEQASFQSARFTADAFFRYTRFESHAFFGTALFEGDAAFNSALISGSGMFESAGFNGNAVFDSTKFRGTVSIEKVTFARGVPVELARFVH